MVAQLYAPPDYIAATPEVIRAVVNGCGPAGWKHSLVPATLWGLNVTTACNIHDWMYTTGSTITDKDEADRVLLNNLLRIVDAAGGWWPLQQLRRHRARMYYEAVRLFGGPAFWAGKNPATHILMAVVNGRG